MPRSVISLEQHVAEHRRSRPAAAPVVVEIVSAPDLVRAGLSALLAPLDGRIVLARREWMSTPDVALFEPSTSTAEQLDALPATCPRLALTWDPSPGAAHRARELGASRIVSLAAPAEEIASAIERVASAGRGRVGRATAGSRTGSVLTEREEDIVSRICRGMSNQEIADELYLSINSVKTYVRTAYRKIGVTRRSQAVLWGLDQGY